MSEIGYYRIKLDSLSKGENEVIFYKNGSIGATHTVIVKERCINGKMIKFLDKNGQYRLFQFNKYHENRDNPVLLGKSNKIITSILNSQGDKKNIGYKNTRSIFLTGDVDNDEMNYISQLWTSPRVYLYIGNNGDESKDWLEVAINGDNISNIKKGNIINLKFEIELPTWYNITML